MEGAWGGLPRAPRGRSKTRPGSRPPAFVPSALFRAKPTWKPGVRSRARSPLSLPAAPSSPSRPRCVTLALSPGLSEGPRAWEPHATPVSAELARKAAPPVGAFPPIPPGPPARAGPALCSPKETRAPIPPRTPGLGPSAPRGRLPRRATGFEHPTLHAAETCGLLEFILLGTRTLPARPALQRRGSNWGG